MIPYIARNEIERGMHLSEVFTLFFFHRLQGQNTQKDLLQRSFRHQISGHRSPAWSGIIVQHRLNALPDLRVIFRAEGKKSPVAREGLLLRKIIPENI